MKSYDAIVIGSGVGGFSAVFELKTAGLKVAIVESDLWGGTCPNRGCDPKKVLMAAVEAKHKVNALSGKGFEADASIDWEELMAFKKTFTDPVSSERKAALEKAGIDYYAGQAEFSDPHQIIVNDEQLQAKQFLIATGQRASILPLEGQEYIQTSSDFLELEHLPKRITFIGAGYIALELATIANAAGAQVEVIHHNDQPLKEFDRELVTELVDYLTKQGVRFTFNVDVEQVEVMRPGYRLVGDNFETVTDMVIGATGRIPNVEALSLEKAGVTYSKKGIEVNDHLQTSAPHIFACGDVLAKARPKLTPVSVFEGEYVAQVMTGKTSHAIDYPLIPTIVFGAKKLARVGLAEKTIQKSDGKYHSRTLDLASWFTYARINDELAKIKFVYDENDTIVAITCLSSLADELINQLTLVLNQKISHAELKKMIIGYPTTASDLEYLV